MDIDLYHIVKVDNAASLTVEFNEIF